MRSTSPFPAHPITTLQIRKPETSTGIILGGKLFAQGWDGFWLDSSEPETWQGESDAVLEDKHLFIGPGARYVNIFPSCTRAIFMSNWRQITDQKRAFILTRSAFAGQQRNATVEWSGDISATFPVLRRQITAGLNFALSGMPYWTTDNCWLHQSLRRQCQPESGLSGTVYAMVRVRNLLPDPAQHMGTGMLTSCSPTARKRPRWSTMTGCARVCFRTRTRLREGHARGLHDPASARDGLAHREEGSRYW